MPNIKAVNYKKETKSCLNGWPAAVLNMSRRWLPGRWSMNRTWWHWDEACSGLMCYGMQLCLVA
uniref:Uncharacterized protein n=1 Tax=Meloidogyne hapla TaxID=6305 RepID=A0A1I8B115_MELHA